MGRDKALIELNRRPLILRIFDRLDRVSDDVFAVARDTAPLEAMGLRAFADEVDVQTPVAGILTALGRAIHPHVFICACDMPFVLPDVIRLLAACAGGGVAVPVHDGRPESLHAVWATGLRDRVGEVLSGGELAVHRVLEALDVTYVDEDEWRVVDPRGRSFVNINTPSDLGAATS